MGSKNDSIYLFLLEEMRTNGGSNRQVKEILRTPELLQKPTLPQKVAGIESIVTGLPEQNLLAVLRRMNKEEQALLTERNELAKNNQMLQRRITEEITMRRERIENYLTDIADLEQECQNLQTIIKKYQRSDC